MSGGGVLASMPPADEMSIGCMGTLDTFRASSERGSQPCAQWMGDTSSRQTPHGKLRTYSDNIGDAGEPVPRRSMAVQGCFSGRVLSDPGARPLSVKSGVGQGGGWASGGTREEGPRRRQSCRRSTCWRARRGANLPLPCRARDGLSRPHKIRGAVVQCV